MVVSGFTGMVYQALLIKAPRKLLHSMLYLRCSIGDVCFVVALFSAVLISETCKQWSVTGVQHQLECKACRCRSNRAGFDYVTDMFDGEKSGSALVSKHSVEQLSHQDICPLFLVDRAAAEVQSNGFSFYQENVDSCLFDHHDQALQAEGGTAWIQISSGNSSKSFRFAQNEEDSDDCIILSGKAWFAVEVGETDQMELGTNLSCIDWLSLQEYEVSISIVLLEGNDSVWSLESQFDLMAGLNLLCGESVMLCVSLIPPKANTTLWMLHLFAGSSFWTWFKKSALKILLAASLLVVLLFAVASQDIRNWAHNKQRNGAAMSLPRSQEADTLSKELKVPAPAPSHVGKEKGRRRRRKKGSSTGSPSGSRSSNSSPTSPLSPVMSSIPKPAFPAPPRTSQGRSDQNAGLITDDEVAIPGMLPACRARNPVIGPRSRAPRSTGGEQRVHKEEAHHVVDEQNMYTYDMWADHLFGQRLTQQSKSKGWNGSESFFTRDPLTVVAGTCLIMPDIPDPDQLMNQ